MRKVGLIAMALVLALGALGVGFAAWTDTVVVDGAVDTGDVQWEFLPGSIIQKPDAPDWNCFWDLVTGIVAPDPEGKNIATTTVVIDPVTHPHNMTITIDNAYPYYYDHIAWVVHGLGSIPLKIWKVNFLVNDMIVETLYANDYLYLDLNADGQNDIQLMWGNGWGTQLHFCDPHDMSFEILVLQPAPQNASLSFDIELVGIQWNEYEVPD